MFRSFPFPKLCLVTNACGVKDETKGDGMLLPLDWNVSPWLGHKAQFRAGPQ